MINNDRQAEMQMNCVFSIEISPCIWIAALGSADTCECVLDAVHQIMSMWSKYYLSASSSLLPHEYVCELTRWTW